MAGMFYENELVIDDNNAQQFVEETIVEGKFKARGLVPRDYSKDPVGSFRSVKPFDMPLIPRNEWSSRIKDMVESESRLSDIRMTGNNGKPIPSLDQNGQGYCWAYSPTSAALISRAVQNLPYVRLSAHAIGCMIKNFRDQGGWNPAAVEFLVERGCPSIEFWPEKSMRRTNNNPRTWEDAAKYKSTEVWMDLTPPVYDRTLSDDQIMTCLLSRIPCPGDFNWMGHSMCLLDPVEFDSSLSLTDPNRWGKRQWNSWTDNWGTLGMGILRGRKAIADGATAVKVVS